MKSSHRAVQEVIMRGGLRRVILRRRLLTTQSGATGDINKSPKPTVLVMGVANHRSIAWACVESFRRQNYRVILTYQDPKMKSSIDKLISREEEGGDDDEDQKMIHALPCNVETEIPILFQERIPELLEDKGGKRKENVDDDQTTNTTNFLNAIVHCIAYAPFHNQNQNFQLSQASLEDYQIAQHISSYSLLETAKYYSQSTLCIPQSSQQQEESSSSYSSSSSSSITALTYLGSTRSLPNYYLMGPAKASLEACVRGLASELGGGGGGGGGSNNNHNNHPHPIRVNAVSAGPIRTLSSRGIPKFTNLYRHVEETSPLRRNVTPKEVADTVRFLATDGTGITGQVIHVDAGYSSIIPCVV